MNRLELNMRERNLHERRRDVGFVVQKTLERFEARGDLVRGRRYERGVTGARPSNPDLAAAELSRREASAASAAEQHFMHFTNKSK